MGHFFNCSHKTIRFFRNQFRVVGCNYKYNPLELIIKHSEKYRGWRPDSYETTNLIVELSALIHTGRKGAVGESGFLMWVYPDHKNFFTGYVYVDPSNDAGKCLGIIARQEYGYEVIENDCYTSRRAVEYNPEYDLKHDWEDLHGLFNIAANATDYYVDEQINDQLVKDLVCSGLEIDRLKNWIYKEASTCSRANGWRGPGSHWYHAFKAAIERYYEQHRSSNINAAD